jgi:hypothetical protein
MRQLTDQVRLTASKEQQQAAESKSSHNKEPEAEFSS